MARKYNLHCVETALNQVFDARLDARRRRIRRGFVYSRLLFVRRSDGRSRIPHDSLPRSIGETSSGAQQNDQLLGRARLLSEQDAVGRGVCAWSSANGRYVHVGSRTRTRLHKTGYLENSNGLSRHYWSTAFDITQERGGSQHLPKNKHQQIWTQTK